MNPETLEEQMAAATAAARRVLVRAIDLRFDLDEAAEAAQGSAFLSADLCRLRESALALQGEINRLAATLEPALDSHNEILEEEQDEVAVTFGH